MARPETERRFLRLAQQNGLLTLEQAAELIEILEDRGEEGLQALRDAAIRFRFLPERVAFDLYHSVSRELREVPEGIARIGGYEVLERIGRGSMAVVYKARQTALDKIVALKILPPRLSKDPVFLERFFREARAAARLNHPNLVAALDAGFSDGFYYFAMEYVDGSSVKEIVEVRGPIEEREALKIVYFVAKALGHAHAAGIVHRDIKPANIMVTREGRVKLTDLGLARAVDSGDPSITQDGKAVGTPFYMSPEQAVEQRPVDARCDIYALGCTLYYMLTGRPPYDAGTPSAILAKHVSAPIPDPRDLLPTVSEASARLVAYMMAKRPEARPQTPGALCEVLAEILGAPRRPEAAAVPLLPAAAQSARAAGPGGAAAPLAPGASIAAPQEVVPFRRPGDSSLSLEPSAVQPLSLTTVRRLRRRVPTSGRLAVSVRGGGGGGAGTAVAIAAFALLVAGGALFFAFSGSGGPERARGRAEAGGGGWDRGEPSAARLPQAQRAAARPAGPAGRSLFTDPIKAQEAQDRAMAEQLAAERSANQERPGGSADEAARLAAEAERLAALARRTRATEVDQQAEQQARIAATEAARHKGLLGEVRLRLLEGRFSEAVSLAEKAVSTYEAPTSRARAEADARSLREVAALRDMLRAALEARVGKTETLTLRSGGSIEGEIAGASATEVSLRIGQNRGLVAIVLDTLSDQEAARLVKTEFGFKHPIFLGREALRLIYCGEVAQGAALFASAIERGFDARPFAARIAEFVSEAQVAIGPAAPPPGGAAPAEPGPEASEPPPERPEGPKAGAPSPAGAAAESDEEGPEAALSPSVLLKLFETQPQQFSQDGRVRFVYQYLNAQKRLGADFELQGEDLRYDPQLQVLKLEGNAKRFLHRGVFEGSVRVESEIVLLTPLERGAALSFFAADSRPRASASIESIFGLALADRRKGKVLGLSGATDALDLAVRELKSYQPYVFFFAIEGGTATCGIDGAVRAHLEGVPANLPRRLGLAFEHLNAQLRSIAIEGRLDLHWVARELARRAAGVRSTAGGR